MNDNIQFISQEDFSTLSKDKKEQIIQSVQEEIEKQRAKYLLGETNDNNILQNQEDIYNKDEHLRILENSRKNLQQIDLDLQRYNQLHSINHYNQDNNYKSLNNDEILNSGKYKIKDYELQHENENEDRYQEQDDEEAINNNENIEQDEGNINEYENNEIEQNEEEEQQQQVQLNEKNNIDHQHLLSNLNNLNLKLPLHNQNIDSHQQRNVVLSNISPNNNYEEEEPKNLEHEISVSTHRDDNNNNIYTSSPNNVIPNYNFHNPINDPSFLKNNPKTYIQNKQQQQPKNKRSSSNSHFQKVVKQYNPKYRSKISKSKEKLELMRKELDEKFLKEHPFKPNITYHNNNNDNTIQETEQQRWNRLAKPKTIDINERMRQKQYDEEMQIKQQCQGFMPNNKSAIGTNPNDVANRLFNEHAKLKEKREKMKREIEDNKIKEFSFAPEINNQSKIIMNKYEQLPLYERNEIFEKAKNEGIIRMREAIEKEQMKNNKPVINQKSKELAMKRNNNSSYDGATDIYTRLYNENIKNEKHPYKNQELSECTFTPNINNTNPQGTGFDNDIYNSNGNIDDFLERQKMYEQLKKDRLEKKMAKVKSKEEYTFKPKINLTSDILMKTNSSRANENQQDKIDRLYKGDYEKIQNRKEQLESFYNAQYDYKPKINELSRYIGREPTIDELYSKKTICLDNNNMQSNINNTNNISSNSLVNTNKSYYDPECTFKPKMYTNSKYNHIQSNYKNDINILERINEEVKNKNDKITGLQNDLARKDVTECKFQPEINKNVPNFENKTPMLMKGMARYLDQMEKARKAKRDKEEREKEVFITGENWSRDNLITVPKPFKLSYQNNNNKKREETKKERELYEMKECTFKPQTNESKNREIIKQLLKD